MRCASTPISLDHQKCNGASRISQWLRRQAQVEAFCALVFCFGERGFPAPQGRLKRSCSADESFFFDARNLMTLNSFPAQVSCDKQMKMSLIALAKRACTSKPEPAPVERQEVMTRPQRLRRSSESHPLIWPPSAPPISLPSYASLSSPNREPNRVQQAWTRNAVCGGLVSVGLRGLFVINRANVNVSSRSVFQLITPLQLSQQNVLLEPTSWRNYVNLATSLFGECGWGMMYNAI